MILAFTRHFLPGFRAGGPVRTLAHMLEHLGDDFEFRIVTTDRDMGDAAPYPGIPSGPWTAYGAGFVQYLAPGFGFRGLTQLIRSTPHDLIYLNSLFDPWFTHRVLLLRRFKRIEDRPCVLAPRGECAAGALALRRRRKSAYLRIARLLRLHSGLVWQASSEREAHDIATALRIPDPGGVRHGTRDSVVIAPNLVGERRPHHLRQSARPVRRADTPLRVCFLSRISPMKNLEFALRALASVRAPIRFTIFGPIEDSAYWSQCTSMIPALPKHIEVHYGGAVIPAQVIPTLEHQDLFFLPTHGENFGHVIQEALCAGLPLLISDRTSWRRLAEQGVGWDLPLEAMERFVRAIEDAAQWSDADREARAMRSRELATRVANAPEAIEANRRLFHCALGAGTAPPPPPERLA